MKKRTIAQTPAPKKERIYGSDINKPKSAESKKSAEKISFGESTIASIKTLLDKHNSKFPNKNIPLSIGKAVVRRGMGAYSSSHRPTIKGGKPNSRTAWGLARLNAFIYKIQKGKSKSGKYSQDNDLIKELGYEVAKYHLGGDMSKHLAPNGKPSNLTHEQWHLVRTPEFKAWFGDWERAYETGNYDNVSKVIDEETKEPLVVWHGTNVEFNVFDVNKTTNKRFHFTTDREYATFRGGISKAYFLKIYNLTYENWGDRRTLPKPKGKFVGFGNLLNDIKNLKEVIVFEPNQIKLSDGTNTTFDSNNPDIRYKDGGNVDSWKYEIGGL